MGPAIVFFFILRHWNDERADAHRFLKAVVISQTEKPVISVAPMMEWTDRHERYFLRLISRHIRLYTEMITTGAVLHGDRQRLLGFDEAEHPVALQLGGSEPAALADCARIGEDWGYGEVNLNVGCPSDRVQSGRFGACLMAEPDLVARCVTAMRKATSLPVTVKCRLGIDDQCVEETLPEFIRLMIGAGVGTLIIHARKAWLEGLSPKENRDIPPLDYPLVYEMKQRFPDLTLIINGGIPNLDATAEHLEHVDGVMLGRAAYQNPYVLSDCDGRFFDDGARRKSRAEIVTDYLPYVERNLAQGVPLNAMTRHILGLFNGQPGARLWRRHLSENAHKTGAGADVVKQALDSVLASQQNARHAARSEQAVPASG